MKFTTIAVLAGILATASPGRAQAPPANPQAPPANPTAAVLADFTKRVTAYAELRKSVEKGEARLERHRDPAKIEARRSTQEARRSGEKCSSVLLTSC